MTVPLYRTVLHSTQSSLKYSRSLLSFIPTSVPDNISVTEISFPRRCEIMLEGMTESQATGNVNAEWVVHGSSVDAEWRRKRGLKTSKQPHASSGQSASSPDEKIILYFHGGAFFMGSPATTRNLTSLFSEHTGSRVLSVAYRLAPENPFPLPLHDAISAYIGLIDPPSGSGMQKFKPSQIVVAGDSAGASLAIALALWIRDNGSENGWKMPAGIVALAPWLDLTHSQPSFHLNSLDYLPVTVSDPAHITSNRSHYYTSDDSMNSNPLVSPLFAKDNAHDPASQLPQTLIQLGSRERLRDEGIMFAADSFKNSPIRIEIYSDMVHIFQPFAAKGEEMAINAFKSIGNFVKYNSDRSELSEATYEKVNDIKKGFYYVSGSGVQEIGVENAVNIVAAARHELKLQKFVEVGNTNVQVSL
ncbi:hypothetical protein HK100_011154 [Physocladia obscura]|uniref:Alpha/beta hydrolase fold-3 domain-containing protein n=1 Tax=Physocladia obscura TaxID=109957 RepID=A0AAD5T1T0_9FUNG|nr:hypothetical protein HK100_011154 [Physocladia obscura]